MIMILAFSGYLTRLLSSESLRGSRKLRERNLKQIRKILQIRLPTTLFPLVCVAIWGELLKT